MADRINASYTFNDLENKKSTKSLTDLSPSATDNQIKALIEGLADLTTNTLTQIERIETTDITAGGKPVPQIGEFPSFTFREMAHATLGGEAFSRVATFSNSPFAAGTIFSVKPPFNWIAATASYADSKITFYVDSIVPEGYDDDYDTASGDFIIYIPETNSTAATEVTVSLVTP